MGLSPAGGGLRACLAKGLSGHLEVVMTRKSATRANAPIRTGIIQGSDSHLMGVTTFPFTGRLNSLRNGCL